MPTKITRGKNVFAKRHTMSRGMPIPAGIIAPKANDIFLHALFARMTLTNNDVVEFFTKYDQLQDQIELYIPQEALKQLSQLTGIKQGANFKTYIAWLIGRDQIIADAQSGGGGGGVSPWIQDFAITFDNTPDTIATIPIADDTTVMIEAHTSAKRTNGSGAGGFIRRAAIFRESGGPATVVGSAIDNTFTRRTPYNNTYDSDIEVSGNDAIITVKGRAANTVDWTTVYNISKVS